MLIVSPTNTILHSMYFIGVWLKGPICTLCLMLTTHIWASFPATPRLLRDISVRSHPHALLPGLIAGNRSLPERQPDSRRQDHIVDDSLAEVGSRSP
jgi:hypothetical protein